MDIIKYRDMAYNNEKGKRWHAILSREDVWQMWKDHANTLIQSPEVNDLATRIKVYAIWYLGYTFHPEKLARCASRLRQPTEGGSGEVLGNYKFNGGQNVYRIPIEFVEFDNFLEHYVRPLI